MSCLRSFNIAITQATTFLAPAANVKTWLSAVGGELYWTMDTLVATTQSRFDIQGFKNIDLYGVQVLGGVKSQTSALTSHGVVNSWGFSLYCEAQNSLVNGTIQTAPNYWALNNANANSRVLTFTNTNPKIEFADPLKSVILDLLKDSCRYGYMTLEPIRSKVQNTIRNIKSPVTELLFATITASCVDVVS